MSVVQSKRADGQMTVITKANELCVYTIKICSNEKNFPKHYRWCLTSKIVDAAITISNYVNMANSVFVSDDEDFRLRKKFQQTALSSTYALLNMMDISYRTFGIDSERIKYWTGLVWEVQNMIRKWKKTDAERYKKVNG